ncbi:MAG: NAD(P)-dependent alcohol dehydrogenase [Gemmatimonadales bacterium]
MKAMVFSKYGSPDVLSLQEVEKPVPKDDEALIRVHAASINDWDLGLLDGTSFVNRLMSGFLRPKIQILGCDVAGRIEAVGANVKRLRPGDEVFGDLCKDAFGSFAEYVCARESALALKPAGMTFDQAAAIPQAAMLAVQGLRDVGKLQPGQRILINGAGGGVGTFAVQIAKLYGAEVTGVDSSGKLDMLRSIGADHVIDYELEDFTRTGQRYDMILDVKTNRSILDHARALNPDGAYVTVGGSMTRLIQALLLSPWLSKVHRKHVRLVVLKPNKDLAYVTELFEAGKVMPVIDGPYKLGDVPEAFRHFGAGHHKGKVIVAFGIP